MEETNKLYVILRLEKANHLNIIYNMPIILLATLGKHTLETEIVQPSIGDIPTTFNCNLIWETDRKTIKRMKSENLPIKIECIVLNDHGERLQSIGYVIISIRVIPILMTGSDRQIKSHWYKFIGFSLASNSITNHNCWNKQKPEILLSAAITDNLNFKTEFDLSTNRSRSNEIPDNPPTNPPTLLLNEIVAERSNEPNLLSPQNGIFIKLFENEGYIQIGSSSENDCHEFIIEILLKTIRGLNEITTATAKKQQNSITNLLLKYKLFNNTMDECQLIRQCQSSNYLLIQRKLTIRLRSSLEMLNKYFTNIFYIPMEIHHNNNNNVNSKIFEFKFYLKEIIPILDLNEFQNATKTNDFTLEINGNFSNDNQNCSIDYQMNIKLQSPVVFLNDQQQLENVISQSDFIVKPKIYYDIIGGGDTNLQLIQSMKSPERNQMRIEEKKLKELHSAASDVVREISNSNEECQVNLSSTTFTKHDIDCNDIIDDDHDDDQQNKFQQVKKVTTNVTTKTTVPKIFNYVLVLKSIRFNREPIADGIWQLSFQHGKADTPVTIVNIELTDIELTETIEFDNLELILYFSSNPNKINQIIQSEPSTFTINGPHSMYATAELDNTHLLAQENNIGIILMENNDDEKIAMCYGCVYLEDLGSIYNNKKLTSSSSSKQFSKTHPPNTNDNRNALKSKYFDEELTYKFINELEQWKLKEQELFLREIKERAETHLIALTHEWEREKLIKEKHLNGKLEQCNKLTIALEEAQRTVKEKTVDEYQRERIFTNANIELENVYSHKLLQLREMARSLEADHLHRLKLEEIKYKKLEMTNNLLEKENAKLKEIIINDDNDFVERYLVRMNYKCEPSGGRELDRIHDEKSLQKSVGFRSNKNENLQGGQRLVKSNLDNPLIKKQQYLMQSEHTGIYELLANAKDDLKADKNDLKMIRKELECSSCSSS